MDAKYIQKLDSEGTVQSLHNKAMNAWEEAMVEEFRVGRHSERFIALATEALNLEKQAAMLLRDCYERHKCATYEPTGTILFSSAINIALKLQDLPSASYLADKALTFCRIEQFTREFLNVIRWNRRLQKKKLNH